MQIYFKIKSLVISALAAFHLNMFSGPKVLLSFNSRQSEMYFCKLFFSFKKVTTMFICQNLTTFYSPLKPWIHVISLSSLFLEWKKKVKIIICTKMRLNPKCGWLIAAWEIRLPIQPKSNWQSPSQIKYRHHTPNLQH